MTDYLHEDAEYFRESLSFTSRREGFLPRLIEKDYFGSLVLGHLSEHAPTLVFKGGTCLAKVHLGFYRMSEDLDFTIPVSSQVSRAERSRLVQPARDAIENLPHALPGLTVRSSLMGANNSTQYNAELRYESLLDARPDSIRIEISLREPLLLGPLRAVGRTLLLDPITAQPHLPTVDLSCIALKEGLSEKVRAALSRRDPAIRDLFDIDHAMRAGRLDLSDQELCRLIRSKVSTPGNQPLELSAARRTAFERQVEAQLRPVLRESDFAAFALGRAFDILERAATIAADASSG